MNELIIEELFHVLEERKKINDKISYTSHLVKNPEFLAKKVGEEASELIIDFINGNPKGFSVEKKLDNFLNLD